MKIFFSFLAAACPLLAMADFAIDLPKTGNALDRFSGKHNIVRHSKYPDTVVADKSDDNALELVVCAPAGEEITTLTVSTEAQFAVPHSPFLEVELIPGRSGEAIPLFIQRGKAAYAFERHTETLAQSMRRATLRFKFRSVWTNGAGESNLLLRGVNIQVQTRPAETVEVEFPDNTNVFTSDTDAECLVAIPGEYLLTNASGTISRTVTSDGERLNNGRLPPGFYTLHLNGVKKARFAVVAPGIQAKAKKSVAQLDFGRNGLWPAELTRKAAKLARLAGVNRIRERWAFSWRSMEPEPGKYVTGPMKEFLALEKAENLYVTFIFMDFPRWFKRGAGYGEDLREMYSSAAKFTELFSGEIDAWEYWNEPDSWPFGKGPAHNYASALKVASLGFHSIHPAVTVATAGFSSIARRNFIENVLANDVVPYFEIYNSHIYDSPNGYPETYARHNELQREYRFTHRAKWITEGGADRGVIDAKKINPKYVKEADVPINAPQDTVKADILPPHIRSLVSSDFIKYWVHSAAAGWESYYSFCFVYYNEAGNKIWGMLAPGLTATETFCALAAYNWLLGDMEYAGQLNGLPKGVQGHLYSNGKEYRAVVWNDNEQPIPVHLAGVRKFYAMTGDAMNPPEKLGSEPVFVEFGVRPQNVKRNPDQAAMAEPDNRPMNPVVLDFVRDKINGTPFKVNTNREEIITGFSEKIAGTLYCYNFGSEAVSGKLTSVLPKGWNCEIEQSEITVQPGDRLAISCVFQAPAETFIGIQRPELRLGGSKVVLAFRCDATLSAQKIAEMENWKLNPIPPSKAKLEGEKATFDFLGAHPNIHMNFILPKGGDGIGFRMRRVKGRVPSYLDVIVRDANGTSCSLRPNIFPLFLDGVTEETHIIRYDQLTPKAISPQNLTLSFSAFGQWQTILEIPEIFVWKAKKQ